MSETRLPWMLTKTNNDFILSTIPEATIPLVYVVC